MPDLCQVHLCQSAQRARQLHAQPAAATASIAALSGGGPRKVQRVHSNQGSAVGHRQQGHAQLQGAPAG